MRQPNTVHHYKRPFKNDMDDYEVVIFFYVPKYVVFFCFIMGVSQVGLIVIVCLSGIHTNAQWTQIGQDIDGEAADDRSGYSVSLSSDGSIVAIGAYGNDGNGSSAGHVRVYENIAGTWTQLGSDIDGEDSLDYSGNSICLSSNGLVLAIGAYGNDGNGSSAGHVRVYENVAGTWTQIGSDIDGKAAGDKSGWSVSLSSNGTIVAIGAPYDNGATNDSSYVRVFENQSGSWTQIGSDIYGIGYGSEFGWSVSLSSDGSIVAIGAPFYWGVPYPGDILGQVFVFQNQAGVWTQVGNEINGEADTDMFGWSVSLSSDGSILAVGARWNDGTDSDAGHVRVFENQSGNWVQIGSDIDGEAAADWSGCSVSLSSDGSIVAIGAEGNNDNGCNAGHVRVYQNQAGVWTQIGNDIDGEAADDHSGISVSLSSDGTIVAIGAYLNDGNGTNAGHVRVYGNSSVGINENTMNTEISIFPNPTKSKIKIEAERIEKIEMINLQGTEVYVGKETEIDLSQEPKGIYLVKVTTDKQTITQKVIKQ